MKRRVVVTGLGAVTPIGNDVESFWNGLKEKKVGIAPITAFDTTEYKAKLAAEVKDFDPKACMDPKTAKRMERFSQFAVAASKEALEDAGISMENEDPYRVGVCVGSGIGSLQAVEREHQKLLEKGPGRVNPLLVPMMISNMAAGNVAIQFGLKGKCFNVVTACATGTHSIGEAFRSIQYGEAEVMVAGGTEASVTPIGVAGFTALTALSTSQDPLRASIPFDKERGGFVMGEGAGVVFLEELEHAKKRGAHIYCEIGGYGSNADAYHITAPAPEGIQQSKCMALAVKDAGLQPEDVDYVNAHGTSTHLNDLNESKAIARVFGDHAKDMLISSTKSMTGHLLGAAGAVEAIACAMTIETGKVHPTINLVEPEDELKELGLNYVPNKAVEADVNVAISNSFGFGGHNATLLFKKYAE